MYRVHCSLVLTVVLMLASMGLGGCQTLRTPTADVESAQLIDQTEYGARLVLRLRLSNPNQVALPIPKTEYEVHLPKGGTFRFTDQTNRTIPGHGEQLIELPAAFATRRRLQPGDEYRLTGRVRYFPPGEVKEIFFDSGLPLPAVRLDERGTLNAGSAPSTAGRAGRDQPARQGS